MVIPLPVANVLLDKINQLSAEQRTNDVFALAGIEREARKLLQSDPGNAWEILSLVAMCRRDFVEMAQAFKNAEALRRNDPILQLNYTISLRRAGFHAEAVDRAWNAIHHFRDNISILREAKVTFEMGVDLEKYRTIRDWIQKLTPDRQVGRYSPEALDRHLSLLKERNLTATDLTARVDAARKVLNRHSLGLNGYRLEIDADGSVALSYALDVTPMRAAEINMEIADQMADSFDSPLSDVLLISTDGINQEPAA